MSPRAVAFLGVDIGSSALRAGLVAADGALLGMGRRPLRITGDPARGRAEQDPEDWWSALTAVVGELLVGVEADVAAISIAGHGPTLTPVGSDGRPVGPAITWLDRRSDVEAADLGAATGLEGWDLGILPAALWVERHAPDVAARTGAYLNTWDAMAARLSGGARSSLLAGQAWPEPDRLAPFGRLRDRIPPRIEAGSLVGSLATEPAQSLGLPVGTPVVAGMVDAFATFHGAGMTGPGDAVDVGGSAGGFGAYWDRPLQIPGSFTNVAPIAGLYSIGGAMATLGASLDWLAGSVLGGREPIDRLIGLAAATRPGADGLLFLPYLAGERSPIWDPAARGAFVGLTLGHDRGHLARAVLEASAFAVRQLQAPMVAAGIRLRAMRVAGGPAQSAAWNQIKADVTGLSVEVPAIVETAVVGAAVLAAVGVGAHRDVRAAIRSMTRIVERFDPRPELATGYERAFRAYAALYPALRAPAA